MDLYGRIFPIKRLRQRQRSFALNRSQVHQPDQHFISDACPNEGSEFKSCVTAFRRMVANRCNCPPTMLLASDSTAELHPVMGETTLFGWFYSLGDLGPDETFFFALENEYERITGRESYFDPAVRSGLLNDWVSGQPFGAWISNVVRGMRSREEAFGPKARWKQTRAKLAQRRDSRAR